MIVIDTAAAVSVNVCFLSYAMTDVPTRNGIASSDSQNACTHAWT